MSGCLSLVKKWMIVLGLALSAGCSVITPDYTTRLGREAVIYSARAALNSGDCATGYLLVHPWYNSAYSDNDARILMASVHGCYAGVKVLDLMVNLVMNPNALSGSGFWRFLAQYFPSTNVASDRKLENAQFAIIAAQAAVIPGIVLNPLFTVGAAGYNPQSLVVNDRLDDANAYLAFSGMAAMGAIQNRFGAPDANYVKTVALPGQTAVAVNSVACQYAAAMINFMDGIHGLALSANGNMANTLQQIDANFTALISGSCSLGCTGAAPPQGVASGCALAACAGCPQAMRDVAATCTGLATDQNSCAAAGLINFINNNTFGWQ